MDDAAEGRPIEGDVPRSGGVLDRRGFCLLWAGWLTAWTSGLAVPLVPALLTAVGVVWLLRANPSLRAPAAVRWVLVAVALVAVAATTAWAGPTPTSLAARPPALAPSGI